MSGTGGRGSLAEGERGRMPGLFSLPTLYVALNPRPSSFLSFFFFFKSCGAVNQFYFLKLPAHKPQRQYTFMSPLLRMYVRMLYAAGAGRYEKLIPKL